MTIGLSQGSRVVDLQDDGHRGADRAGHQIRHAAHQAGDVHRRGLQGLTPRERQQPVDEGAGALGRFQGAVDQALFALAPDAAPGQHVEGAQDGREQIVEVVRHAAGELAHALQLLGLEQGLLRLGQDPLVREPLGDVGDELKRADALARVVSERAELDLVV